MDPLVASVVCAVLALVAFVQDKPRAGWGLIVTAWGFLAWAFLG